MRHLLYWIIAVIGLSLLLISAVLSIQRRDPSAAYWLFTSEQPASSTLFKSHNILDSNLEQHHSNFAQGEFIHWSPNTDYYFIRFESFTSGQKSGLYRFHNVTGQSKFLLPTAGYPHSLQMKLSSDGQWLEFSVMENGEQVYYHVRPDGSELETIEPQQNEPRSSLINFDDDLTIIGKMGATHENLPDDQRYFVHHRLSDNWLIVKATIVRGGGPPRSAPVLYRMRRDKSELRVIFEDNLARDPDVINWEENGNILYVIAQGDTNSLFRVDMSSGDKQMLIENYQAVRNNCFDDSTQVCPPVYIDPDFEWVIWRTTNVSPEYRITSIQSGETQSLYDKNVSVSHELSMISPDNRWLYVSYVDNQSRGCVLTRISLEDKQTETSNSVCLMSMSPVIDLPVHSAKALMVAILTLFTSLLVILRFGAGA